MKTINLDTWNRKEHFEFFSKYDEPYFGIVSDVECTRAYNISKAKNISFFSYYLHKALIAINEIEEFKYRIVGNEVIVYEKIHASPTIGRDDGTFGFSFVPFNKDYDVFNKSINDEIKRVQNSTGLAETEETQRKDVVHFSAIPWFKFTGITHPCSFNRQDSIPKISFGKATKSEKQTFMSVSINGHHGLIDGLHVGKYLKLFQELLNGKK
jgi:chloramphenicol O-acetyltransferase type A